MTQCRTTDEEKKGAISSERGRWFWLLVERVLIKEEIERWR
jgi:hypothetical protein